MSSGCILYVPCLFADQECDPDFPDGCNSSNAEDAENRKVRRAEL